MSSILFAGFYGVVLEQNDSMIDAQQFFDKFELSTTEVLQFAIENKNINFFEFSHLTTTRYFKLDLSCLTHLFIEIDKGVDYARLKETLPLLCGENKIKKCPKQGSLSEQTKVDIRINLAYFMQNSAFRILESLFDLPITHLTIFYNSRKLSSYNFEVKDDFGKRILQLSTLQFLTLIDIYKEPNPKIEVGNLRLDWNREDIELMEELINEGLINAKNTYFENRFKDFVRIIDPNTIEKEEKMFLDIEDY